MREIKFRAWDKRFKLMLYPDNFYNEYISADGKVIEIEEWSDYSGGGFHTNDVSQDYILMQYTGLKDKTGKEIYEGDVVQILLPHESFIVEWDEIGTGYLFHHTEDTKRTHGIDYYEFEDKSGSLGFEVIGNIYEHPHLIGGESDGN